MPKATNYTFHSTDSDELDRVYDEYVFIGRNVKRFADKVVVYAYPKPKPVKPKREERPKRPTTDEEKPKVDHTQRSKRERWYE